MSTREHPKRAEGSYSNSKNRSSSRAGDTKGPTVVRNQTHVVPPKAPPTIIDLVDSPAKSPVHGPPELAQSPSRPHSSSKSAETVKDPKQRLDEIEDAVKPFLQADYMDGKITKDDYVKVLNASIKSLNREFGKKDGEIPTSRAHDTVERLVKTKQRMDEIADAVRPFLRPYYRDGKITHDVYVKVFGASIKSLHREFGKKAGKIPTSRAHDTVEQLVKRAAKP